MVWRLETTGQTLADRREQSLSKKAVAKVSRRAKINHGPVSILAF